MITTSLALRESPRRDNRTERKRFVRLRVAALHAENLPTRVIADRLQLPPRAVRRALQSMGLSPHGRAS